jgi:hypothetical protein
MAPASTSKRTPQKGATAVAARRKSVQSKLSFTPKTSSSSATADKTKTARPKPNQSILNFFKKAPANAGDEDGLFIGERSLNAGDPAVVELELGKSGYEDAPEDVCAISGTAGDDRFNEADGSVKRRKLSPCAGDLSAGEEVRKGDSPARSEDAVSSGLPLKTAPKRPRPGNPFLDEEEEEEEGKDAGPGEDGSQDENGGSPAANTTRVRLPTPLSVSDGALSEQQQPPPPIPDSSTLTNRPTLSREIPLPEPETPGTGVVNDGDCSDPKDAIQDDCFDLEDDDFTGEELDVMRYMEEQARIEAEEDDDEEDVVNESEGFGESRAESCPVCNGSLTGATTEQATTHVNSCLDGDPTPLPTPTAGIAVIESAAVSKRFAKAAVPRPGQTNPISLGADPGEGSSASAFTRLMSGHAEDVAWATAAAAENAARGMPAYKRTCPFYKIMPGFSVCVDAFRYGAVEGCKAYFLSHFHSDHYIGLTANWTHGPIYCSKVTGSLVKSQLKTAAKYVVELQFEQTVPVPETNGVTVTMIPANHCPGSSLFLFEKAVGSGRTQRILHCGDFRACPAQVEHPRLRPETADAISGRTRQQKIDVCYLDTTYLSPKYSFPPQHEVIRACAEMCALLNKGLIAGDDSQWEALLRRQRRGGAKSSTEDVSKFFTSAASSTSSLSKVESQQNLTATDALTVSNRNRNRLLVVCGTYSIGKERICVAIAQALNTKIYASPAKIRMCRQLDDAELSALLTPNPLEAQVHMQMLMEIRAETLAEYLETYKASFSRIVGFRPSGWNYRPSSSTGTANGATIKKDLPPTSLPTTQLLHGAGWHTRFALSDLVPQRGAGKEVMCFGVPYSEHSSFRELAMFLMALRIEKVVPTVNVGSETSRRRMKAWIDRWLGERRRGGLVRVLKADEGKVAIDGEGNGNALWDGKDGRGGGVYW